MSAAARTVEVRRARLLPGADWPHRIAKYVAVAALVYGLTGPRYLLKPAHPTAIALRPSCSRQHDEPSSPANTDAP